MSPKTFLVATAIVTGGAFATVPANSAEAEGKAGATPVRAAIMFNMLDQNGDGVIDAIELETVTAAIIAATDTDADGSLSQAEFNAILKHMGPPGRQGRQASRGPRGDDRGGYHRGPRGGQHGQLEGRKNGRKGAHGRQAMAERFDIGEDGMTQADFLERQAERFASLDTDGDGNITMEEMAAARKLRFAPPSGN